MQSVIVDTSSIVFAFSNNVNIFRVIEERMDFKPVVSAGIKRELSGLSMRRTKEGRAAKLALQIVKKERIESLGNNGNVDDFLVQVGSEGSIRVCTNDIKLKGRLRSRGIRPLSVSKSGVLR